MTTNDARCFRRLPHAIMVAAALAYLASPALVPGADCNGNGADDGTDITAGTSTDCDLNSVPDECNPPGMLEDFDGYTAGADPAGWFDTGADNSLLQNDSLFAVADFGDTKALWTANTQTNIHSHYVDCGSQAWSAIRYTGRMRISHTNGGIGVTFLSAYPDQAAYYRLRRHQWQQIFRMEAAGTIETICTPNDLGVTPQPGVWYRFKIETWNAANRTDVRAKVWEDGTDEPAAWQAECYDDTADRLTGGTVGVWSMGPGEKAWDDQQVERGFDCDGDGVPETFDAVGPDCDSNGAPNWCEIASGVAVDCNGNGIPDDCDVAAGTAHDCDGNSTPDDCDLPLDSDCNSNGVIDRCDPDLDGDGRVDGCDNCWSTANSDQADIDGDGLGDACDPCSGSTSGIISQEAIRITALADHDTIIPGTALTHFTGFHPPVLDDGEVVFYGSGVVDGEPHGGIYTSVGGPLRVVADTTMTRPGSSDLFNDLFSGSYAIDGGLIVFSVLNTPSGIYASYDNDQLVTIAETGTPIPSPEGRPLWQCVGVDVSMGRIGFIGSNDGVYLESEPGYFDRVLWYGMRMPGFDEYPVMAFDRLLLDCGRVIARASNFDLCLGTIESFCGVDFVITPGSPLPGGDGYFSCSRPIEMDGMALLVQIDGGEGAGLYVVEESVARCVVRSQDIRPDGSGDAFGSIRGAAMSGNHIVFATSSTGSLYESNTLWTTINGQISRLLTEGDVVNGVAVSDVYIVPGAVDGNTIAAEMRGRTGGGIYLIEILGCSVRDPSPDFCDASMSDVDVDGAPDYCDNCLTVANEEQADSDEDGLGDACDNCPHTPTDPGGQIDSDGDGWGDVCDRCPGFDDGLDCTSSGIPDGCKIASGESGDCDLNGIPDVCEEDCNNNSMLDMCEIAAGTTSDCNASGVPDVCEVAAGTSPDCNSNGAPDECDPDFDGDTIPDDCDADADGDGVLNTVDFCLFSPLGVPVNPFGGPMGDLDDDCLVTLDDYFYFEICLYLSGPNGDPGFQDCRDIFDFDGDGDVDLADYAGFARAMAG